MPMIRKFYLIALLLISGCSGDPFNLAEGGIGGSGIISEGPISSFGSIFVNGVRYDTSNAELSGILSAENELELGMVVTVEGSVEGDSGIAERVYFNPSLIGALEALDLQTQSLNIAGQTVFVDDFTIFANREQLNEFVLGDWLHISAIDSADGQLLARWIRVQNPEQRSQLTGIIEQLDSLQQQFQIRGKAIDYRYAEIETSLEEGAWVRVEGELNTDVLLAQKIKAKAPFTAEPSQQIALHGQIRSNGHLTLGQERIELALHVQFELGQRDDVRNGQLVTGIGERDAEGNLVLSQLRFLEPPKIEDRFELRGHIEAISTEHIQVSGKTYNLSGNTVFHDKRDRERHFNGEQLHIGDYVRLLGAGEEVHILERTRINEPAPLPKRH